MRRGIVVGGPRWFVRVEPGRRPRLVGIQRLAGRLVLVAVLAYAGGWLLAWVVLGCLVVASWWGR